jgi:hypothetical protein
MPFHLTEGAACSAPSGAHLPPAGTFPRLPLPPPHAGITLGSKEVPP